MTTFSFRSPLRRLSYIMLTTNSVSFALPSPGLSPNPATSSLPLPTARTIASAARSPANSPVITSGRTLAALVMPSGSMRYILVRFCYFSEMLYSPLKLGPEFAGSCSRSFRFGFLPKKT